MSTTTTQNMRHIHIKELINSVSSDNISLQIRNFWIYNTTFSWKCFLPEGFSNCWYLSRKNHIFSEIIALASNFSMSFNRWLERRLLEHHSFDLIPKYLIQTIFTSFKIHLPLFIHSDSLICKFTCQLDLNKFRSA